LAPKPRLVRPNRGPFNASNPFPDLHQPVSAFSDASTSLQEFYLPPDQRVQRRSNRWTHLPVTPDSLSLPAAVVFWISAADHRSGVATFP
jgi:hypothetical protein